MEIKKRKHFNRHLIEFTVLILFSILVLNPFGLSVELFNIRVTPEITKQYILSYGSFAPLLMIFLEALQVLIAPLPPITMVASGYTFGILRGSVYSFIGMSLGSTAAILISRRFGKPLTVHFVNKDHLEKFHRITEEHGLLVFTLFFLAPGFPHDILCYIAGLTDLDLKKLIASVSLGRLPTLLALVITGRHIASSKVIEAFLILSLLLLTGFIAIKNEDKIVKLGKTTESVLHSQIPGKL